MKIIQRDITTIDDGVICHACNCQNKFNKGLVKIIRKKFPIVYSEFTKFTLEIPKPWDRLGLIQEVKISEELSIVNMFTQLFYGNSKESGIDYNDYSAWVKCVEEIKNIKGARKVYFPFNVGCGLAGGDWNKISEIICRNIPDVIFCKYGE